MKQMNRQLYTFLPGVCLLAIFSGWLVSPEIMFAQNEKSTSQSLKSGTFRLKVTEGQLSVEANQASLAKIFEEIGKQAGIAVESSMGQEEKITIQLNRVPLEEGFKRLAKNVSVFYSQDLKDKTPRVTRVVVLGEEKARALSRVPAPTQVSKASEPVQTPEPFKFEFDPSKLVEKGKPIKSK